MVGPEGSALDAELRAELSAGLRGVVLFARNIEGNVSRFCREVADARGAGILIGIDQEGGRVARLRDGYFVPPPMKTLGDRCSLPTIRRVGTAMGQQLRRVGINLNFAPVLDVDSNPENPVIGNRSFSGDPRRVAACASAFAAGLQLSGVAACGKHFPGHGDTTSDSHLTLPFVEHDSDRLEQIEQLPFREAIAHDFASLMTAHVVYRSLDPAAPATLSPTILEGLLRERLGFRGVVISDDLEMGAITQQHSLEEAAVAALIAGVDLLLCCHSPQRVPSVVRAVQDAVTTGILDEAKLIAAHRRVDAMADRFSLTSWTADRPAVDEAEVTIQLDREIGAEVEPGNDVDPTNYMGHRDDGLRCELSEGPLPQS